MKYDEANANEILGKIALRDKMIWKDPEPFIFDRKIFERYVPKEYKNSDLKESDEVYYMNESVFIHKMSGMRISYLETENYIGDESEFKLLKIFIITLQNKRFDIVDVDFSKEIFLTSQGEIPFSAIKKTDKRIDYKLFVIVSNS